MARPSHELSSAADDAPRLTAIRPQCARRNERRRKTTYRSDSSIDRDSYGQDDRDQIRLQSKPTDLSLQIPGTAQVRRVRPGKARQEGPRDSPASSAARTTPLAPSTATSS